MQNCDQLWPDALERISLAENEVHVWKTSLDLPLRSVEHLRTLLIDEEASRAARFYFERDRKRWIVAHAVLRRLLGSYLAVSPQTPRFTTGEYGKPALSFPQEGRRLRFNLSHSGDLALYAFAYEREVGVDVEQMRANVECAELATHYFSPRECASLRALPAEQQEEAFFLCWSRKEAYIKARGMGLSLGLDQFDVSLIPGEPARLLGSREEPCIAERWSLQALWPGAGYAGAVVAERTDWQLRCWQWREALVI
jgi:4'-phosphopantetheinyl transferase